MRLYVYHSSFWFTCKGFFSHIFWFCLHIIIWALLYTMGQWLIFTQLHWISSHMAFSLQMGFSSHIKYNVTYYEPYGHDRNAMWNAINDTGMTSCVLSCCDTQWRARCVHIIPVVCYARPTDYFFLHITHSRCANRSNSL
jgi:hypothetical protein